MAVDDMDFAVHGQALPTIFLVTLSLLSKFAERTLQLTASRSIAVTKIASKALATAKAASQKRRSVDGVARPL